MTGRTLARRGRRRKSPRERPAAGLPLRARAQLAREEDARPASRSDSVGHRPRARGQLVLCAVRARRDRLRRPLRSLRPEGGLPQQALGSLQGATSAGRGSGDFPCALPRFGRALPLRSGKFRHLAAIDSTLRASAPRELWAEHRRGKNAAPVEKGLRASDARARKVFLGAKLRLGRTCDSAHSPHEPRTQQASTSLVRSQGLIPRAVLAVGKEGFGEPAPGAQELVPRSAGRSPAGNPSATRMLWPSESPCSDTGHPPERQESRKTVTHAFPARWSRAGNTPPPPASRRRRDP